MGQPANNCVANGGATTSLCAFASLFGPEPEKGFRLAALRAASGGTRVSLRRERATANERLAVIVKAAFSATSVNPLR